MASTQHRGLLSVSSPLSKCVIAVLALGNIALTGCVGMSSDESNSKVALVIGNGDYQNVPALSNPLNDAQDICAALHGLGFRTLCHTDVKDRAEFDAFVRDYVDQLGSASVGVLYYSGHGVQAGNENFLIPTQAQLEAATDDPLRILYGVTDLFERLAQRPIRFQLVILDACRTDLFADAGSDSSGRGSNVRISSTVVRSLETVAHASSGLAPIKDAPTNTIVLYATASKDAAFDGDGRNGPLTKHILQHIAAPGVPVEEFIKRVTRGVENETTRDYNKRQTPYIYGSFAGKFCFAGCPILLPPSGI